MPAAGRLFRRIMVAPMAVQAVAAVGGIVLLACFRGRWRRVLSDLAIVAMFLVGLRQSFILLPHFLD